ncbi:hypothetical protein [Pseudomonas gingeri]|uniref:Uncharacterized protein n=1 Tax=Pseudomonas gingeri TaxID=117681 RepID=A0A7Y7YDW3_9PSED|nr:hypothetical protein [Pseudomonas gingeri]NVZ67103.1 hypothetical protein [Pseudomonas gingeri]NWB25809.1 hypothetical protein [Pseudomonas gingeri]NWC34583.1 hypothetical protein [Pseudomonas gingeri]NWD08374.1 hypothetical protein [Pseudomonas gingeri]NWE26234.1 hypothetical protein [Pseudomonas gingeri]
MSRYADLDIFSSFLSLKESTNPYSEAVEMIRRLDDVKGGSELKELREQLRAERKDLEALQEAVNAEFGELNIRLKGVREHYRDALKGDAVRIGADFRKAARQLLPDYQAMTPVLKQTKAYKDMMLVNDNLSRHTE